MTRASLKVRRKRSNIATIELADVRHSLKCSVSVVKSSLAEFRLNNMGRYSSILNVWNKQLIRLLGAVRNTARDV